MAVYLYKARSGTGSVVSGKVEASERRLAIQKLRLEGLTPITLEASPTGQSPIAKLLFQSKKLGSDLFSSTSSKEAATPKSGGARESVGLIVLNRLMELHGSGLPVGDSVRILSQRISEKEQRNLLQSMWKDLSEGATLAGAMARHPRYFPTSVSYVIEAGEATGHLTPILRKIIDYLEEKRAIRKKMVASMVYPGIVCSVAVGVVILFMTVLLPRIQGMMDRLGGEMTWTARLLIDGSGAIAKYGPFVVIALILTALFVGQWRRSDSGRRKFDRFALKMPLLGKILFYSDLFQVGNLISTLLQSGINTTETLRLTERTVKNTELQRRFNLARNQVNEGSGIAQAFQRNDFFPELAIDILAVGENTGNLAHSMNEVTRGFREELSKRLNRLITIVSTGALVGAFLLVALIAMGIVTSVFQVSSTLSR